MRLPQLIPPPDLLDKIDGVEEGLRKRRRLGVLGFVGALASLIQILYNSEWLRALLDFQWSGVLEDWPTLLFVLGFALGILLFIWARFWLRESRRPFRYTYYVGDFRPVDERVKKSYMAHLPFDLSERLSDRITRLSRFDEDAASDEAKARRTSHVHVEGDYLIRRDLENGDRWTLEVLPWVRVGPPGNRETLALPVKFPLDQTERPLGKRSSKNGRPSTGPDQSAAAVGGVATDDVEDDAAGPPALSPDQYGLLVERVYYSIATQLYKEIRADVRRKINLLPTRYFRATAYYNEAHDYARSNTLDAYEAARDLYNDALAMFDPYWSPDPQGLARRALVAGRKLAFRVGRGLRRTVSRVLPTVGRVDVMMARAMIGYADMVLYRHILAGMAGLMTSPIFEARPVAELTVADLQHVRPDVPGQRDALFDAYVTFATAYFYLGSTGVREDPANGEASARRPDQSSDAASCLDEARKLDPARAERDPKYLFVSGQLQPRIQWELRLLRRAVELDPKFEVAQFELAQRCEFHWRGWPSLERGTAKLVVREYQAVLTINPGNIKALARLGDLYWLLAPPAPTRPSKHKLDSCRRLSRFYFLRGEDYKAVRQATFVAELEYGLARLAAEAGNFEEAYDLYSSAVSAHVAFGAAHAQGGYTIQFGFFNRVNAEIVGRYRQYAGRVADLVAAAEARDPTGRDQRIRNAVHGYALHDYGEACFRSWLRYGGDDELNEARDAFKHAWELSGEELVFSAYNLYLLELHADQFKPALEWVDKVQGVERQWPDGRLARRAAYVEWARRARNQVLECKSRLEDKTKELEQLQGWREGWHRPLKADPGLGGTALGDRSPTVNIAVPALSLPPSQADMAIRHVDERIGSVKRKIQELQKRLEMQEGFLQTAKAEAGRSAQDDVPHAWLTFLWGKIPDVRCLKQVDRVRRRWERELDDVQVRMLINWAFVQWVLASEHRSQDADAAKVQTVSRLLLERLQRHFWPDDLDVLAALRAMEEPDGRRGLQHKLRQEIRAVILRKGEKDFKQDHNQRIRAIILQRCDKDPQYGIAAWAMLDEAFTTQDRLQMLERLLATSRPSPKAWAKLLIQALAVADSADIDEATKTIKRLDQESRLPADVWSRVGQDLVAAGRLKAGQVALTRAVEHSQDPELLGQLGDELAAIGASEQSLLAFKKGLEVFQEREHHALPA